jgi:hypothetical protein
MLVLNREALLINEVGDLGRRPKGKHVDVQPLWVGLIDSKGTQQSIVLQNTRTSLSKITCLRDCDKVGPIEPNGSLRSSIGTPEPFRMTERQGTDPIHDEPGQQEQRQINVGSPQKQIQTHDRIEATYQMENKKAENNPNPNSKQALPHILVDRSSHHIHRPDRAQNTMDTITKSTETAQVSSNRRSCW